MAPPDLIDLRTPETVEPPEITIEQDEEMEEIRNTPKPDSDSEDIFLTPLNSLYIEEEAFYSTLPVDNGNVGLVTSSADTSGEVEQCLMELDSYLQSLESEEPGNVNPGFTLGEDVRPVANRRRPASAGRESRNFCRRNPLRSTWTATSERLSGSSQDLAEAGRRDWSWIQDIAVPDVVAQAWLRRSMRRARPIILQQDDVPSVPAVSNLRQNVRPASAPVQANSLAASEVSERARSSSASSRSRRAMSLTSTESGSDTSVESSCADSADQSGRCPDEPDAEMEHDVGADSDNGADDIDSRAGDSSSKTWPHSISPALAGLACTLGLFNVSRFAVLSTHFGAPFIIQFLVLSGCLGIPFFSLQLCLGHQMCAGPLDMWRVSPIFRGVGVALLFGHALLGVYTIMPVSWMFTFFRDSFITKLDKYRWAEPFDLYRESIRPMYNGSYKLSETVADYFNGVVLQRHHLASKGDVGGALGSIKFQLAFNLAVVWLIVFVALSKGLRSYGKALMVFSVLPLLGLIAVCVKFLTLLSVEELGQLLPATQWDEFFLNTKSWIAASQETFLTWGLLGAAAMQSASQGAFSRPRRDTAVVVGGTLIALLTAALLGNACVKVMKQHGYDYHTASFERISTYTFMRPSTDPLPPALASVPPRFLARTSLVVGERAARPGIQDPRFSGYQAVRLATELLPASFALLGPEQVSPFWSVLSFFTLILLGVSQQLAIWYCVVGGALSARKTPGAALGTTATFLSCATGFLLGLPLTTELGIFVIYFLDYCAGGAWWLAALYLLQVTAVFLVRGRPYSGDTVVRAICPPRGPCVALWAGPLLAFVWNVVLPVALMVLCITGFKSGGYRELYQWRSSSGYWPLWSRQLGAMLQLIPLLLVPMTAVVQTYRYLNNGPPDILERIQQLYRPPLESEHMQTAPPRPAPPSIPVTTTTASPPVIAEDPPPKYTPPPSYTTATGARIAKMLRQSFRRSVRRITNAFGESSAPRNSTAQQSHPLPPPDYDTVLVEMSPNQPSASVNLRHSAPVNLQVTQTTSSSMTATDVAQFLRSSLRRSTRPPISLRRSNTTQSSTDDLVPGAAPMAQSSCCKEDAYSNDISTVI